MTWLPTALEHNATALVWICLAALLEAAAYFSMASAGARERWRRDLLALSAPLSYVAYSVPLGVFRAWSLLEILAAALVAVYWFKWLPRSRWTEYGFVALIVAPILFKLFPFVYNDPLPGVHVDFLGHLLWIRLGVLTVLRDMCPEGVGFGFWPDTREWKIGAAYYCALLPVVFAMVWLTGFARIAWPVWPWWEALLRVVLTFFGILWVVALSEEFFFRGLLQRWAGLAWASALFGMAHLGFRQFPNWRFAIVAGAAGVFYGLAYRRAGGIRAAMVTHALTVVTWRILFR